ncbi:Plasma membrane proteolipid 3 [Diplocarpon rosae]|nr:Plasma membrane proteolipid 3 [Diplocarpon rosae]
MGACFFVILVLFTIISEFSTVRILKIANTVKVPPLGVLMIAGCGPDFLINIIFTLLGYFPGHVHAIYLIVVFYHRRGLRKKGVFLTNDAPMIFSHKVQSGGLAYRGRRA